MIDTATIQLVFDKPAPLECASELLKALSHPLRLRILCCLSAGEFSVGQITDQVGTSQSNVSQHLSMLRDRGVICSSKRANQVYYRIHDLRTCELISLMCEVY